MPVILCVVCRSLVVGFRIPQRRHCVSAFACDCDSPLVALRLRLRLAALCSHPRHHVTTIHGFIDSLIQSLEPLPLCPLALHPCGPHLSVRHCTALHGPALHGFTSCLHGPRSIGMGWAWVAGSHGLHVSLPVTARPACVIYSRTLHTVCPRSSRINQGISRTVHVMQHDWILDSVSSQHQDHSDNSMQSCCAASVCVCVCVRSVTRQIVNQTAHVAHVDTWPADNQW